MKYKIVYLIIKESDVVYASEDKESANGYAEEKNYKARIRVLKEWSIDDPTNKDIAEADYQVGYDGDFHEVKKVDISNLTEDDTIEIDDGTEIHVSDILENLDECNIEDDFDEDDF